MKPIKLCLAAIMLAISCDQLSYAQGCTCVNSLIINTGYDPCSGTALPPAIPGGPPVEDPKWEITQLSPACEDYVSPEGLSPVYPAFIPAIPPAVSSYYPTDPLCDWISIDNRI